MRRTSTVGARAWLVVVAVVFAIVAACSFKLPTEIPCESNLNCPYPGYCSTTVEVCAESPGVCLPLPETCGPGPDSQCPIHHQCIQNGSTGLRACERTADPAAPGNSADSGQGSEADSCNDGVDNDCNGQVDCADSSCEGSEDCSGVGDDDDPLEVNCTNWCLLYRETCLDAAKAIEYGSDQCHEDCQRILDWAGVDVGLTGELEGNTLSCRMAWLGLDGEGIDGTIDESPEARCSFGGLMGGRSSTGYACADRSPEGRLELSWPYCVLGAGSCAILEQGGSGETGWNGLFPDFEDCLTVANELPRAEQAQPPWSGVGNSLECRLGRLELAVFEPDIPVQDRPVLCIQGLPQSNYCTDPDPPDPSTNTWTRYEGEVIRHGESLPWHIFMADLGNPTLYDVTHLAGTRQLWVVGSAGLILYSDDGGLEWELQETPTQYSDLYGIDMVAGGSGYGWAVGNFAGAEGEATARLHAQDWGATWTDQSPTTAAPGTADSTFHAVFATSETSATVFGGTGVGHFYQTADGGGSWSQDPVPFAGVFKSAYLYIEGDFWRLLVAGEGGTVLRMKQEEMPLWSFDSFPALDCDLWAIDGTDDGEVIVAVGSGYGVFHGSGSGPWTQGDIGLSEPGAVIYDVYVEGGTTGNQPVAWAVGSAPSGEPSKGSMAFISHTASPASPNSWVRQTIPDPANSGLRAITCLDADTCWAVGEHGTMMSTGLDSLPDPTGDDDDASSNDCASYCAERALSCGEPDVVVCQTRCNDALANQWMAPGTPSDTIGNSLGCRIYHTSIATVTGDPIECDQGNLFGGTSANGFPCSEPQLTEAYCALAMTHCTGPYELFSGYWDCLALAGGLPTNGQLNTTAGNYIECRIYHLEVAASGPEVHCPHGSTGGGGVCSD